MQSAARSSLGVFRRPLVTVTCYSLLSISLLLVSACQPSPPDTVKVRLQDQQSYRYLVSAEQRWEDGHYPAYDGDLRAWQRISVSRDGEQQWQLTGQLDSYDVHGPDIDGFNNRQLAPSDDAEAPADDVSRLLQQPFQLQLDKQQRSFQGEHLQQLKNTPRSDDDYFIQALFSQDAVPLVNTEIPADVGATFSFQHPQYGKLSGEVTQVTDDSVSYKLQNADDASVRVYSIARVDREQGWVLSEATISDWQSEADGRRYQRIVSRQREDQVQPLSMGLFDFPKSEYLQHINPNPADTPSQSAEQVLSYPIGTAYIKNNRLNLVFNHQLVARLGSGHIELSDIRVLDKQEQPIELELLSDFSYEVGSYSDEQRYLRSFIYHDIGQWSAAAPERDLTSVTANAEFFPYHHIEETLVLPEQDEQSSISLGKARLTVSGTSKPHIFDLSIEETPDNLVYRFFPGADNLHMMMQRAPNYPDWIPDLATQVMSSLSAGHGVSHYRLRFDGKVPKKLTAVAQQRSEQATLSKALTFYPDDDEHQRQLPPREFATLTADSRSDSTDINVANAVKQVKLQGQQQHRLYTRLSSALASVCELRVVNDASINGQPLQWQPAPPEKSYSSYRRQRTPQRSANQDLWQLRTADGEQQYFYGVEVTTELRCDGEPNWQSLAIQDTQRPWLIDLRQLPEQSWQAEQPVEALLARYRFFDDADRLLALQPRDQDFDKDLADAVLADYLIDEHYLKVAGPVSRIEHLQITGESYQQQWQTTFSDIEEVINADSN
ncbi:hypothetical protein [Idiomarina xiamenensis]|uniref:Lipoprotein n=1 Tax=Idiomarina xiamenensis 10-D-4 TaxID=740709 RepID=K2KHE1_9GAMM|nr:hypothetical protein [Idiomarina xiamenensis]EKE82084.1 hypothetical protein A10D4_09914 [Idiomarina xiamenensis 10-D-4]